MRLLDLLCGTILLCLAALKVGLWVGVLQPPAASGEVSFSTGVSDSLSVGSKSPLADSPVPALLHDSLPGSSGPGLILALVTLVEAGLGISFLMGRSPRASALGLVLLGAGFCLWTLFVGPRTIASPDCGCFGPFELKYAEHALVAGAVLALGGVQAALVPRRSARRGLRPDGPSRIAEAGAAE